MHIEELHKIDRNRLTAIFFLAALLILGFFSDRNLADRYVNNTPVNSEYLQDSSGQGMIERDYTSVFAAKEFFVNLNGLMRRVTGQREMNEVVKLDNGYLATTMEDLDDWLLEERADKVSYAARVLDDMGVPFVYVATPETIAAEDSNIFGSGKLPAWAEDYGNINMDVFLQRLRENGTNVIDLRGDLHEEGIDPYSIMYRTDHHWTMEGGFYAYTKLAEWIRDKTGKEAQPASLNLDYYDRKNYRGRYLGSRGIRTGSWYAGTDDFELYLPKEDVLVTDVTHDVSGSFADLVLDLKPLELGMGPQTYLYDRVLEKSLGTFENPAAENDARIMILCDSMGEAVCPFLILGYRDVYYLDSYYPGGLTASLVEEWQPDAVILLQYPGLLKNDYSYDFTL